jgi:uncharacterized cupredoxin-like copper-binding protein
MRSTFPRCAAALALAVVLTLSACGGEAATPTTGGAGISSTVVVKAKDSLTFDKDAYTAKAGTVEFVYENTGALAHDLLIDGLKGFKLAVGKRDQGTVDLQAGEYTLYCDIAGHRAAGMEATLTVS